MSTTIVPVLTEAEWRFVAQRILALQLQHEPHAFRARDGSQHWLCPACRSEVWWDDDDDDGEMRGHRLTCPRQLRYAIVEKLDDYLT